MTGKLGVRRRMPPGAGLARDARPLSAGDVLAVVAPDLPVELVPTASLSGIRAVAREWPVTSEMGFECRLDPGRSGVDFGLCIRSGARERTRLLEGLADPSRAAVVDRSYRGRLLAFLADVCDGEGLLGSRVRNLCFELDLSRGPAAGSIPGIFVGLWHPGSEHLEGADPGLPAAPASAVLAAVGRRLGEPLPPAVLAGLDEIERTLPVGAFVANLGVLPGRGLQAVRVNVGGRGFVQEADRWLGRLGWPGSRDALAGVLALAAGSGADVYVNVDVGTELQPSLGLELFFHRQPERSPACVLFLERLTRVGLCSPSKRDALLAWPGATGPDEGPWPARLAELSALLGGRPSVVVRILNHLKLSMSAAGSVEAKAYLSFGHRWIR